MEMYPTYTADGGESVYEEHDIATMHAWNRTPAPPRSSYSSPPPSNRYRTSFDNVALYAASPRSPAPSSAPPAYPPAHAMYSGYFAQSEPSPDNYYWYAGAPPSVASSQTRYHHHPPSSAPGDVYSREDVPGFFGVRAPHHHPGNTSRQPMHGENLPNFPQWSRTWYDGHMSANGHAYTNVPPPDGASGWESDSLTRSGGVMPGAYGHVYGARGNVADLVKEERIRMLEKQFGKPKISHGQDDDETLDERDSDSIEDVDLPLGAVNSRGKLVTERPKWKTGLRWLLGIVSIACFALGIGSALLIKPGLNAPAARGSIASYVLYIASAITVVLILYLFVFRPCCCDPMRKEMKMGGNADNPLGGMIIPVLTNGGGPKKKPFRKGKKGMMMMGQQAPTVNLIVDPALLGIGKRDDPDEDEDERLPGDARRSSRRKNGVGVLGNMQMQRRWMMARKTLKMETVWDAILCVIWIAVVILALGFGKKCPPGDGNGWCNYYNGAIACGAIMAALFACVLFLDYRDLKMSKKPPKPPM